MAQSLEIDAGYGPRLEDAGKSGTKRGGILAGALE